MHSHFKLCSIQPWYLQWHSRPAQDSGPSLFESGHRDRRHVGAGDRPRARHSASQWLVTRYEVTLLRSPSHGAGAHSEIHWLGPGLRHDRDPAAG